MIAIDKGLRFWITLYSSQVFQFTMFYLSSHYI